MAVLYTSRERLEALRELRIKTVNGQVNTHETARILTWRAKAEYDIEHVYPESAVRRHVERKTLNVAHWTGVANRYKVEDVFEVPITPKRGIAQKKIKEVV